MQFKDLKLRFNSYMAMLVRKEQILKIDINYCNVSKIHKFYLLAVLNNNI